MAKKGQKFNKYSKEIKQEIMNKYLNNEGTSHYLAKEYNIPLKTVNINPTPYNILYICIQEIAIYCIFSERSDRKF